MARWRQNVRRWPVWLAVCTALAIGVWLAAPGLWPGSGNIAYSAAGADETRQDRGLVTSEAAVAPGSPAGNEQRGLAIELEEGSAQPQPGETVPPAAAEPLDEAATEALLGRLPALQGEAGDVQDFRLPEASLPAPRTGVTVQETFPPTATAGTIPPAPDEGEAGPLEVLRFAPQGEIPVAPFLSVTFSQPMVPLATVEQLSAADVPVTLTPEIPGEWKWVGTKTLTFEYKSEEIDRFPKATEYMVEVPAGTTSATGGVLEEAVRWTFTTPPPVLEWAYPTNGPQPRQPLLFAEFDQRVAPSAVLEHVTVTAGGRAFPVRAATREEIEADPRVSRLVSDTLESRWVAFVTEEELPADTTVNVAFGAGTPSAEGPLTTAQVQGFSFQTYAPLRITETHCNYSSGPCPPLTPFYIYFNNPLDEGAFDPALVEVTPEIAGLDVMAYGNTIQVRGLTQGRTEYTVRIDGALRDLFGQTLGKDEERSLKTGDANRFLTGPGRDFVTLDPAAGAPAFTVYSINFERLRVRAYAVGPEDWRAWLEYESDYRWEDDLPEPPGEKVLTRIFQVHADRDSLAETAIDLSQALPTGKGHLIVIVDFPPIPIIGRADPDYRVMAWVQVTDMALDAFVDSKEIVGWATSLADGAPLEGVELELRPTGVVGETGPDGTARLALASRPAQVLVGRRGDDVAMLPYSTYYWDDSGWQPYFLADELRWYVFDDRQMYRPGEEVHVKGWIRHVGGGPEGDVTLPELPGVTLQYQLTDAMGNEVASGTSELNNLAGFDVALTLPTNMNLGYGTLYFSLVGPVPSTVYNQSYGHTIQVQEFRRPEFEVTARNESKGPFFVGDSAVVAVEAKYYAGGPLPNAEASWDVTAEPGSYSPPNWPDFTFGSWVPWWYFDYSYYGGSGQSSYAGFASSTDATGTHYLRIKFLSAEEPRPYSVTAAARVMDVNRQTWVANTNLLVHPAALYVGLRSESYFVQPGTPLKIDAIVTDLDGEAQAGVPVEMRAVRLDWKYEQGEWREVEEDVQECTVESTAEPVSCEFQTPQGGRYSITATVKDGEGRTNLTRFDRWVSGGRGRPNRNVEQESLTLVPDKENYAPGDVAEIMVEAPFSPASALLTVGRSGLLYTETVVFDGPTAIVRVPIEDAHTPNLTVQVDAVGAAPRLDDFGAPLEDAPARPAYASGVLNLPVPPLHRALTVALEPAETELEPGATTTIELMATDAAGEPVADAELAVVVVDEAVLALTNYQLQDPLLTFYTERGSGVESRYGRESVVLENPLSLAEDAGMQMAETEMAAGAAAADMAMEEAAPAAEAPMAAAAMPMATAAMQNGRGGGGGEAPTPIAVRTDFNPLALFAPAVRTDSEGRAQVEVKLPDNLTRYRIMVAAVAGGKQFGMGEANLTARLPLMVRPSAPRFLNFGDRFEMPVVVQNQTDAPLEVDVALRSNILDLAEGAGRRVSVPANDRVEVRFPMTVDTAGTARFQVAAASGDYADAATGELPVYTPATTEAFATYGVLDEGAVRQPVATPEEVFPQFGGLEISTSSTALQALTDAVLYLVAYPFECSEQIASRVLGVAALRDVLTAFRAEGLPAPEELEAAVARDIERLAGFQNVDGGFPIWRRGQPSIPFYSIHGAHALQMAKVKGFDVPEEMLALSRDHLRNIEQYYPYWYSQELRDTLTAYALYVRKLMGDVDTTRARQLVEAQPLETRSLEMLAWLWQVLADDPASAQANEALARHFTNRAVETPSAASFVTDYGEEAYLLLHTNRRTDALVLDALINAAPESDLIPKVVNGLLAHRTAGHWQNTQENVFVLLALDRYFNTYEAVTPDFVARVWLGDAYVAEHEFRGRSTETRQTTVPVGYLVDPALGGGTTRDLTIAKEGEGRLYYRLGLRYAPVSLDLEPLERGFVVQRSYEAVDDPADVSRDADGVWHVKAGARVRVVLNMVADSRRYHVALADPLPAGFEAINPALAVSESVPGDPGQQPQPYWWWGPWYEHQNLRDQRAEAFTTLLWEGVYRYEYVARATTPGSFVVPPAKAEEMYTPEVFGRSGSDRVIVE